MNPSILHFSRVSAAWKALLFLAVSVALAYFAYAMQSSMPRADAPLAEVGKALEIGSLGPADTQGAGPMIFAAPAARPDPLAVVKIPFVLIVAAMGLFYVGRYARRALIYAVAVRLENRQLWFHSSYWDVPGPIAIGDVMVLRFDRADRLPKTGWDASLKAFSGSGYWAMRLGARMRYMLHIEYRDGRDVRSVRLVDNDIDGGAVQLERFAAYVESHRAAPGQ